MDTKQSVIDVLSRISTTKNAELNNKELAAVVPYLISLSKSRGSAYYNELVTKAGSDDLNKLASSFLVGLENKDGFYTNLLNNLMVNVFMKGLKESFDKK